MLIKNALIFDSDNSRAETYNSLIIKYGLLKALHSNNIFDAKTQFINNKDSISLVIVEINEKNPLESVDFIDFLNEYGSFEKSKHHDVKFGLICITNNKANLPSKYIFKYNEVVTNKRQLKETSMFISIEEAFKKAGINHESSQVIRQRTEEYRNKFLEGVNKRIQVGDSRHAELLIRKKLDFEPDWVNGYIALASILIDKNEFDEAINFINKAKSLSEHVEYVTSVLLLKIDAIKGNLESIDLSELNNAKSSDYLIGLISSGNSLLDKNLIQGAEEKFNKAISINPSLIEARLGLAKIHQKRGKDDLVQTFLSSIPCPDILATIFNLKAVVHAKKSDTKNALKYYKEALNFVYSNSKKASINYNIGLLYLKSNNPTAARKYLLMSKDFGNKSADSIVKKISDGYLLEFEN